MPVFRDSLFSLRRTLGQKSPFKSTVVSSDFITMAKSFDPAKNDPNQTSARPLINRHALPDRLIQNSVGQCLDFGNYTWGLVSDMTNLTKGDLRRTTVGRMCFPGMLECLWQCIVSELKTDRRQTCVCVREREGGREPN